MERFERFFAASGFAFIALFGAGVLASGDFPALDAGAADIERYFRENTTRVLALAFFHTLAAVALVLFGSYVRSVLRGHEERARLSPLASGASVMATTFLLLSAGLFWVLALPAAVEEPAPARALLALSYLTGGLFLVLSLGVFIGATSIASFRGNVLPGWLSSFGLAVSGLCLAAPATLFAQSGTWSPAGVLVLLAGLVMLWLFSTTVALVRRPHLGRAAVAPA